MISFTHSPSRGLLRRLRREPKIFAVFSFRYDAHLVPDLIANITPFVDGWVSFDDRQSKDYFFHEGKRHAELIAAAGSHGAQWVLAIDPDERLESGAVAEFRKLAHVGPGVAWSFPLRELYAPDTYRIDGPWGSKRRTRLFPFYDASGHESAEVHARWVPAGLFEKRKSSINLYHLKMIAVARRQGRRDLYNRLDPDKRHQRLGYDYLIDENGAVFKKIAKARGYHPPHIDDGGLWMAEVPKAISS